MSCCGTKPRGESRNVMYVNTTSPPYAKSTIALQTQSMADRPAVHACYLIEQAIEAAEEQAQDHVDRPDGEPAEQQAHHHARREINRRQSPLLPRGHRLPLIVFIRDHRRQPERFPQLITSNQRSR